MNLKELKIGKPAIVTVVGGDGALRQHFLDMGIIPGVEVEIVKYAPRGDPMEVSIHGYELTLRLISYLMEDTAGSRGIPTRFAARKMIEGDERVIAQLNYGKEEKEIFEGVIRKMEQERGLDRSASIADYCFSYIRRICETYVVKPKESKEHKKSTAIDKILTGKYTAVPFFIGIMALTFYLTFNVIGAGLQNLLAMGIDALTEIVDRALTAAQVNEALHRLITSGIFEGVGSVLSFLPIIVTMFFFLSLMEDSGYIARMAFSWISR